MVNRYHGTNPALTNAQELHGRGNAFHDLDDHITNRRSVVVMGVEGVGKSSLLNCYFNPKYRKQMALSQHILIRVTDFPTDRDTDGIYQYLAEGVLCAVDTLDQEETKEIYQKLREKCARKMSECQDTASRFQQICEVIQDFEYAIMLVIDGFERFVSSPHVKMEHHNLMNNLISKNLSFVVATNYDFNQDSLPAAVSGSFLLMKFSGNEICLKGLSEADCGDLLHSDDFSQEELHQQWILSGGIPAILRRAAEHVFEAKQSGPVPWKKVFQETYADTTPLLSHWCKLLSKNQVRVLKDLAGADSKVGISYEDDALRTAAQELVDRGLLTNPIESGTLRTIPGLYKFNTPLLKLYCKEHDLQAETILLRTETAPPQAEAAASGQMEEIDDEKLIEMYGQWAEEHGYPRPVNYNHLPDELLNQYQLSRAAFDSFDEKVRKFVQTGIFVDQTLLGVEMPDHSPAFIEFAKSLEAHLNHTVFPVLRAIDPTYMIKNTCLCDMDHLMLGQFITILNWKYRFTPFTERAGRFCTDRRLNGFPMNWWEKLRRELSDVGTVSGRVSASDIRNDMMHVEFVSAERGEALLRMMFSGERSLFNRCQLLHDEAVKQGLIEG